MRSRRSRASKNWKLLRYDVGHRETPEMREQIRKWFTEKL
jgi:hypothetical protein